MSETCAGYLKRVLPDTDRIVELIRGALGDDSNRVYALGEAVGLTQKLIEDLQRALAAAKAEA